MEAKIQSQIIDFFSFLEDFYSTSKTCLKTCQNYAVSINKIIRRCKNIKEAQIINTPLEEFEGLQNKLLSSLHNIINCEIREIQSELSSIEELCEKLCYKNKVLQENCKDIDFSVQTPLVKGSPLQPPLEEILHQLARENF
ncbi:unnamed protein product [Colias eurytheme]|nr:unnamed protein product [Colias eurytheme]